MSLVRISQYNKDNLPRELNDKLYQLARKRTGRPFVCAEHSLYLLAFRQSELLGFIELKCEAPVATLRNIIVDNAYATRDIALKLLRAALTQTVKQHCQRVQLACKQAHIDLFRQAGFFITTTPQEGDRSQFYIMENPSPAYFLNLINQATSMGNPEEHLLVGTDTESHNFHNESQYLQLHHSMFAQARKQIWMLSDNINNPILNDDYTSRCLLRLIKRNPNSEIRLLLANDKIGAGYYNPTINLAQRLSSYIEIRTLNKTGIPFKDMITVVDISASIYRRSVSSMTGFANFNNPLMATRLKQSFEHHWAFAKPSLQLRRLAI